MRGGHSCPRTFKTLEEKSMPCHSWDIRPPTVPVIAVGLSTLQIGRQHLFAIEIVMKLVASIQKPTTSKTLLSIEKDIICEKIYSLLKK